jgi:CheY-like chemotaxis protein
MKKTLLVVEDDQDILMSMVEFLESEDYNVRSAANGYEGLHVLSTMSELPSVIILDLMMPGMDGFKFREEQEKNPRIANIPIILMTADSQIESQKMKLGAVEYVRKPLNIECFSILLRKVLGRN